MEENSVDISISMAMHYLCSGLEKDKKSIEKLASVVSKKSSDDIYMFLMGLGVGIIGISGALSKLDKNFDGFAKKLCDNLNTDDTLLGI